MRLIDSHTHLNTEPLFHDREFYLQQFIDIGGVGLVNSGASEAYNIHGIEIARAAEHDFKDCIVKATLGRHPLECAEGVVRDEDMMDKIQQLKDLYADNADYIVAIGETGIDLHYPNSLETLDMQKQLFDEHCKLARELDLPLVIHSRDGFHETLAILKDYPDLTIYFHCRGYGPEEFRILNAIFKKLYIGFCGNITYKKTDDIRETLNMVPLDRLLLETDAPYLTPQIVRGQHNHPANVRYIYDFVAEQLHMDPDKLSMQIEKNFKAVYRLP